MGGVTVSLSVTKAAQVELKSQLHVTPFLVGFDEWRYAQSVGDKSSSG